MPPPSPVWAWSYAEKKRVFVDTTLRMSVTIEGAVYESNPLTLKVDEAKKIEKGK
jgi:hypothetical protein